MTGRIRPTTYQVQMRIFEVAGCVYVRTQGDHLVYHYPGAKRPVVIPKYKEVPVFIIRNNMKVIGMSVEEYNSMLNKV
ncbi:MAG: type II toxin-antitoxin system HicA family toxin [Deltaproteobacteria bacterium]|nr:MAG: type II toxin-antitoxin system HicA family toxin [Deltaproteobacteria bacterium]